MRPANAPDGGARGLAPASAEARRAAVIFLPSSPGHAFGRSAWYATYITKKTRPAHALCTIGVVAPRLVPARGGQPTDLQPERVCGGTPHKGFGAGREDRPK